MRRRLGSGAAPAEACGVWLDTAELQRGPARPLSTKLKAATRIPGRKPSLGLLPEPGTRRKELQTTIPTFFSPHSDERDKENSRPSPCTPKKHRKDSGVPLTACPVKILPLPQLEGAWEEPPGAQQGTSRAWKTPLDPLELQVEPQSPSRTGGDSWCCSLSPGSVHSGVTPPKNKSRLFPGETAPESRTPQPWSRVNAGAGSAGTANTTAVPGAAPRRVCCSPPRAQPLRERGQDPQGNRGSADRASPSPRQPQGSEALFTQDSQGNRVIKHW